MASTNKNLEPMPLLTGMDLIFAGLKPGRQFGIILSKAYAHQLANTSVAKKDLLKEALKGIKKRHYFI